MAQGGGRWTQAVSHTPRTPHTPHYAQVNGQHAFMRDESSFGRYDGALALMTYDLAIKTLQSRLGGGGPAAAAAGSGSA